MIFDLHNDFPTVLAKDDWKKYLRTNNNSVITAAIWTSEFGSNARDNVLSLTDALLSVRGSRCSPIAIEDIGFLSERDGYKTFDFDVYTYCSLTWNYNNAFAGGALDDGRLTDKGKKVIDYINNSRCVVDVAHLNKKSFFDVIDCADKVICSHTGFNKHARSLDDSQIRELIDRKSIIGLSAVSKFTDAYSIDEFTGIIDRFVQKYGLDNLALGTDFYGSDDIPKDIDEYRKLDSLTITLKRLGYADSDCEKIFYENALNFFK